MRPQKKRETFPNLAGVTQQNIPDKHLLDFFVALSSATEKATPLRRRHDMGDPNRSLLRNLARGFPVKEKIAPPRR